MGTGSPTNSVSTPPPEIAIFAYDPPPPKLEFSTPTQAPKLASATPTPPPKLAATPGVEIELVGLPVCIYPLF